MAVILAISIQTRIGARLGAHLTLLILNQGQYKLPIFSVIDVFLEDNRPVNIDWGWTFQ